jgi:hypothetical protein
MSIKPYLRAVGDGTYELVVQSKGGRLHVLPYCFHSNEDAVNWLATPKGREQIEKLRNVSSWRKTAHKLFKFRSKTTVLDIRSGS